MKQLVHADFYLEGHSVLRKEGREISIADVRSTLASGQRQPYKGDPNITNYIKKIRDSLLIVGTNNRTHKICTVFYRGGSLDRDRRSDR